MTDDTALWTPVSSGDYNDYDLAFVNINPEDDDVLTLNVNEEDIVPDLEDEGPDFVGTYEGFKDISSEDNPDPSFKHLVESDDDERTYAFNKSKSLDSQLEEGGVEEGDTVGISFEGVVEPDDGGPSWYNYKVFTPSQ